MSLTLHLYAPIKEGTPYPYVSEVYFEDREALHISTKTDPLVLRQSKQGIYHFGCVEPGGSVNDLSPPADWVTFEAIALPSRESRDWLALQVSFDRAAEIANFIASRQAWSVETCLGVLWSLFSARDFRSSDMQKCAPPLERL